MWYFAWILGVLLACAVGIINVLWLETTQALGRTEEDEQEGGGPG
jgi:cyd operon protein YbgT